jgi:PiT family inorganic phosphate transporter
VTLTIVLLLILVALIFEYINGFHDTANSIATVVATKVLSPTQALALAAGMNLIGALSGVAVAKTISSGLVDPAVVSIGAEVLICALAGGIIWNLLTWWLGLPSSSSHALIGGLCGAAPAAAHDNWAAIIWSQPADPWYKGGGLLWKVIVPMVSSPLGGFLLGMLIMGVLFALLSVMSSAGGPLARLARPRWVNGLFGKAQILSAAFMGYAHGLNDAQKTMGIIALALFTATGAGVLDDVPGWLEFLRTPVGVDGKTPDIATWIKITCAIVMAAGTAAGGWRIIKTLGHKMVKLHPINGFAAETASATMISVASSLRTTSPPRSWASAPRSGSARSSGPSSSA